MPTAQPQTKDADSITETALQEIGRIVDVTLEDYEYLVISDGSGHHGDKIGACCSIVLDQSRKSHPVMLAQSMTTVTRMEFRGLIEGLTLIKLLPDYYPGARVLWICDNQSMVEAVADKSVAKANEDLWVLYDYFAMSLTISSRHISRENNNIYHNLCDLHASTLREVLLDYTQTSVNFKGLDET